MKYAVIDVTLGTTVQVNIKRYDDGTCEFAEITNKPGTFQRNSRTDEYTFLKRLYEALSTVA